MDFNEFLQPGIFSISGKPGAGKSYFSVRVILAEIKKENRQIVTNVPINVEKLREYAGVDCNISQIKTFEDNRFFFTQRGTYEYEFEHEGETIDFSKYLKDDDQGVLYIIDEAHLYFNSRNWKSMAQATLCFFTFIRHCGDTLLYLTQKHTDVDSQLRGKTQTFNLIRNLSRERLGWMKRGTGFRLYQYLKEQDIEGIKNPVQDFSYSFKLKIAECYRTSLFNTKRDKKFSLKGITVKHYVIALVILGCGGIYWLAKGGIVNLAKKAIPDIPGVTKKLEREENKRVESRTQLAVIQEELVQFEIPTSIIMGMGNRFQELTKKEADQLSSVIYGQSKTCKLAFFVEKLEIERGLEVSFNAIWREYLGTQGLTIDILARRGSISTDVFEAFWTWARNKTEASTMKEVTVILKETIPTTITQGFEIPIARTVATQGVQTTNFDYKRIGFTLSMTMENDELGDLLKVQVENSQIIDQLGEIPTLVNFDTSNIYNVDPGRTYEIAIFDSVIEENQKKILGSRRIVSKVKNRVFIMYGL